MAGADTNSSLDMASIIKARQEFVDNSGALLAGIPGGGASLATAKEATSNLMVGGELVNIETVQRAAERRHADFSAAATFGTTPGNFSATIMEAASVAIASQQEFQKRSADIAKSRNVGFLDNPVEWFANQISMPFEIDKANAVLAQGNVAQDFISKQIKLTQDAVNLNAITNTAASASYLEGLNKINAGKAQMALSASQAEVARIGLNALSIQLANTHQVWQSVVETNNIKVREAELSLRQTTEERAKETSDLQNRMTTYAIQDKEKQESIRADFDERLKVVAGVMGIPPVTFMQLQTLPENSNLKKLLTNALFDPDYSKGRFAGNPWYAAIVATESNFLTLSGSAGTARTVAALQQIAAGVEQKNNSMWPTYQKTLRDKMILDGINNKINEWRNDAESKDSDNIFAAGSLRSTMAIPRVSVSPLMPYLSNASNSSNDPDGIYKTKYTDILEAGVQAVIDGKITREQAAKEITDIYTSIATLNTETRGYQKLAIVGLSADTGYNVMIRDNRGNLVKVNTLNESANKANLIRAETARKLDAFRRDTFTSPTLP